MRLLLTGATGFVGASVTRGMVADGHDVAAVIRDQARAAKLPQGTTPFVTDGTVDSLVEAIDTSRPDIVIHLATHYLAQHQRSDIDDLLGANISLGTRLLEAMSARGVRRMINFGTSFQHFNGPGYNPVSLYAATKQAFEAIAAYYVRAQSFSLLTLKLSDTYGPSDPRGKIISSLLKAREAGEKLVMSAGEQRLSFLYIDDAVAAIRVAIERLLRTDPGCSEIFAVRGEDVVSLRELVSLIDELGDAKIDVVWGGRPYRDREVMQPWIGPLLPDWAPRISLREGIKKISDV